MICIYIGSTYHVHTTHTQHMKTTYTIHMSHINYIQMSVTYAVIPDFFGKYHFFLQNARFFCIQSKMRKGLFSPGYNSAGAGHVSLAVHVGY